MAQPVFQNCQCCILPQQAVMALQAHEVDAANTTASFRQFHVDQIAADMKESICRVSDGPFDAQENVHVPTVSYEVSHNTSCCWHCISLSFTHQPGKQLHQGCVEHQTTHV